MINFLIAFLSLVLIVDSDKTKEFKKNVKGYDSQDVAETKCWEQLDEDIKEWREEIEEEGGTIGGFIEYTAESKLEDDDTWSCSCKKDVNYTTPD